MGTIHDRKSPLANHIPHFQHQRYKVALWIKSLSLSWFPGHTNELAKEATLLSSSTNMTITHALRRAHEGLLSLGISQWRNHSQHGHYAQSDHILSSLCPPPRFTELEDKQVIWKTHSVLRGAWLC
ncbi:hypothetical protein NP233_g9474 [Leucocoprinus birnbaumii]|uniref:Uncharacterized protein n=1 Tax=Leucocoprinus birnbaumii TaxID=56174 RepID=A0AAD5YSU0_9AGAR|nr:hypothetical protein NP233_g9474 [Leucocoprinus birnbaumii]